MTWNTVEAAARAVVLARDVYPLVWGERVAWSVVAYHRVTDGFSDLHRVKDLDGEAGVSDGHTFCGETIPPNTRRVEPDVWRSLDHCMTCEIALGRCRDEARDALAREIEAKRWPA